MNDNKMNPNARLSFLERFAYGIGDYAGNLVYSAISAFLLVYYTNVVGASAAAAASIIAISKIFDGISDLVMGYIIDHTHSKWGKARPWIARLCIPLAVCTVLMFTVPASFVGKTQLAYMFLTYNLVSTIFYTGINVPYATLNGLMTTNQYERGLLGNFRNLLATAGTMTINTVVLKMTAAFGGGDVYSQKGWTLTFIVLMIVFVILNMFTFFMCKERVVESGSDQKETKENRISFFKGIKGLFVNKYWVLLVIAIFAMYFMMSCFFGSAVYFAQYNVGNAGKYAIISNCLSPTAYSRSWRASTDCVSVCDTVYHEKGFQEKSVYVWNGCFRNRIPSFRFYNKCNTYLCIICCKGYGICLWRSIHVWSFAGCDHLWRVVQRLWYCRHGQRSFLFLYESWIRYWYCGTGLGFRLRWI